MEERERGWTPTHSTPSLSFDPNPLPHPTHSFRTVLDRRSVTPAQASHLINTMLDVVYVTDVALAARVRFASLAATHLKTLRHRLPVDFTIDWRPLAGVIRAQLLDPTTCFEGPVVKQQLADGLLRLCRSARRFYGPAAPAAVWGEHAPTLTSTPDGAAFEAVGWLRLLLRPAKGDSVDWSSVALTLTHAMNAVPGDGGYWDAACLGIAGE